LLASPDGVVAAAAVAAAANCFQRSFIVVVVVLVVVLDVLMSGVLAACLAGRRTACCRCGLSLMRSPGIASRCATDDVALYSPNLVSAAAVAVILNHSNGATSSDARS